MKILIFTGKILGLALAGLVVGSIAGAIMGFFIGTLADFHFTAFGLCDQVCNGDTIKKVVAGISLLFGTLGMIILPTFYYFLLWENHTEYT